ncbi:hypothetical protein Metvu_0883 [Methanocaldococcus vulcanius M7]|uniref:Uncharacterized protein n=1 Tax=Methanocaldococcus vulcanius (strain ATCC 700851 / DSM 12094 / M7) TaxID=579137 RepID=C9RGN9_METVM|nr:hypothetical protein Metvu_0883 [Methanocaldococcus vulcanius M7]
MVDFKSNFNIIKIHVFSVKIVYYHYICACYGKKFIEKREKFN